MGRQTLRLLPTIILSTRKSSPFEMNPSRSTSYTLKATAIVMGVRLRLKQAREKRTSQLFLASASTAESAQAAYEFLEIHRPPATERRSVNICGGKTKTKRRTLRQRWRSSARQAGWLRFAVFGGTLRGRSSLSRRWLRMSKDRCHLYTGMDDTRTHLSSFMNRFLSRSSSLAVTVSVLCMHMGCMSGIRIGEWLWDQMRSEEPTSGSTARRTYSWTAAASHP